MDLWRLLIKKLGLRTRKCSRHGQRSRDSSGMALANLPATAEPSAVVLLPHQVRSSSDRRPCRAAQFKTPCSPRPGSPPTAPIASSMYGGGGFEAGASQFNGAGFMPS